MKAFSILTMVAIVPALAWSGAVAVSAGFEKEAPTAVTSETGTSTMQLFGNPKPMTADSYAGNACFESATEQQHAIVSGLRGVTAGEGFTLDVAFKPCNVKAWRSLLGFRLGGHNFRLENVSGDTRGVGLLLYADNGKTLTDKGELIDVTETSEGSRHVKTMSLMAPGKWHTLRLTCADGQFRLWSNGQPAGTFRMPKDIRPGDALTELVIGRGRDGQTTTAALKPGLYAQYDALTLRRGTEAKAATAGAVAVAAGFDKDAPAAVTSETGTPAMRLFGNPQPVIAGACAGDACFESVAGRHHAIVSGIQGVTLGEGFTLDFAFKPRSRVPWRSILGFRLGGHNFRLESVEGINRKVKLLLYADNGTPIAVNAAGTEPPPVLLELEKWYALRLTCADGLFRLWCDGQPAGIFRVPEDLRPDAALTELTIGIGRDGQTPDAAFKPGLYAQYDALTLRRNAAGGAAVAAAKTVATPKPTPPAPKAPVTPKPKSGAEPKPEVSAPLLIAIPADGSVNLAPARGPLPGGTYPLAGGTLRIRPAQTKNPATVTVTGHGRVEIVCGFSDLEVTLDAKRFSGDVAIVDAGTGSHRKLVSSGLRLGPAVRLTVDPGCQLFVPGPFNVPRLVLSGAGERNGERFGALRMGNASARVEADIELLGDTTFSAHGTLGGHVTHRLTQPPTLTLGSQQPGAVLGSNIGPMTVRARLGSLEYPLGLIVNHTPVTLQGDGTYTLADILAPVTLRDGTHRAAELRIAPLQTLRVRDSAVCDAGRVTGGGTLAVSDGGTLAAGADVAGVLLLEDGAHLRLSNGRAASAGMLTLPERGRVTVDGSTEGFGGGRHRILSWTTAPVPPKAENFALAPALAGAALSVENGALWISIPYAMAAAGRRITVAEPDGKTSEGALSEAGAFLIAQIPGAPKTGDVTLRISGDSGEGATLSAAQAANVAYLLNLVPAAEVDGSTVTASFACHFGVDEITRRTQDTVDVSVRVEPFDGMGTLGPALNGYVQILGKTSAEDRQWAILGEAGPGTPYRNGRIAVEGIRTLRGGHAYRLFGARLAQSSYRK